MLWTLHPTSYKANMKFLNLGPPCCMPRPKIMRNSWILKGRLQYILARELLRFFFLIINGKKKSPKVTTAL